MIKLMNQTTNATNGTLGELPQTTVVSLDPLSTTRDLKTEEKDLEG